jgi:hypothetical protein
MKYVLVIILWGGGGVGTSPAINDVPFPSESTCQAALNTILGEGWGVRFGESRPDIRAYCLKTYDTLAGAAP